MDDWIREYVHVRGGHEILSDDEKEALIMMSEAKGAKFAAARKTVERGRNEFTRGVYDFFRECDVVPHMDPRVRNVAKGEKGSYKDGVMAAANDMFIDLSEKKKILKKLLKGKK